LTRERPAASLALGGIVERHASESYYVLGEGLLAASAGGRDRPAAGAAPFRFSRMGPDGSGHQLDDPTTERLAEAMTRGGGFGGELSDVPSGFTYLGQFIAHDLSFDRTVVTLGTNVSPARLLEGTSPSLDLDSLYGAGPQDPESARFYEHDRVHLKLGATAPAGGIPAKEGFDLPRGRDRKAVIADERNDENVATAQTHLAFIRFHNRVVDSLPASVPPTLRFPHARELVTKHYQWMIRSDYLPRICSPTVLDVVFGEGRRAFEAGAAPTAGTTMPIEFSIGTFRLGHSMVRSAYSWNRVRDANVTLDELFRHSAKGGDLGGRERLASTMIADFRRLYDFGAPGPFAAPAGKLNFALRIDSRLVHRLSELPSGTFGGPALRAGDPRSNLAFRNLIRARMVKLATGQQMAAFLAGERGVPLAALTEAQILTGDNGARLDRLTRAQERALAVDTPLWFYVLREAELNGGKLKGVGAQIVAETFHRAIEGSSVSIVRDATWRPTLGRVDGCFGMVDLLRFAFEEDVSLLAPLEG
jgi:hypothetical protein